MVSHRTEKKNTIILYNNKELIPKQQQQQDFKVTNSKTKKEGRNNILKTRKVLK